MLRRVSLILVARRLGIHLADVAEIVATLPIGRRRPSGTEGMSRDWKRELEGRRRFIENLEHQLVGRIGCGCLWMKARGLLNPDDGLAERGQGPVRLDEASR